MSEAENKPEATVTNDVPTITREQAIAAIKTCYDPEIPVDIWELGLIYELSIYGMNNIYVRMTLTSPSCPAAGSLPTDVEEKLKGIPGVQDIKVELVWDPPYNQSMMSEEARLELGFM
jgi:FeS assembly SUF system protein